MVKEIFKKYDLIINHNYFQDEFEEFLEGGFVIGDPKTAERMYLNEHGMTINLTEYWSMRAKEYAQKLLRDTEDRLDNIEKEALVPFTKTYKYYLKKTADGLAKFQSESTIIFFTQFNEVIPQINNRFKIQFEILQIPFEDPLIENAAETKTVSVNSKNSVEKIKWLGQLNVLTTLFYDLMCGQDKGLPMIEASPKAVEDFIRNNFVDSEGHELSKDTVESYLKKSKIDKKAKIGDRIELGNLKRK